jgi:hypothetical protein
MSNKAKDLVWVALVHCSNEIRKAQMTYFQEALLLKMSLQCKAYDLKEVAMFLENLPYQRTPC